MQNQFIIIRKKLKFRGNYFLLLWLLIDDERRTTIYYNLLTIRGTNEKVTRHTGCHVNTVGLMQTVCKEVIRPCLVLFNPLHVSRTLLIVKNV